MTMYARKRRGIASRRSKRLQALLCTAFCAMMLAAPRPAPKTEGVICVAPFHVKAPEPGMPPIPELLMSQTTWAPSHDSKFKFHIDGHLKATVANDEMVLISNLPTDRRVRIKVSLDGRPFEAFSLDLGKEPEHRVCLWLYPGYWHWIDNGWSENLGCKCRTTTHPAK
jgi:hypothetical protein